MSSMMFRQGRCRIAHGFTLIELMITVAIVAVLAAIAFPSYQDSVWKGKRAEAKAAIFKALQAEERYYTQNNTYVQYSGIPPGGSGAFPVFSADNAANSRYQIKVDPPGAGTLCVGATLIAQCAVVIATVIGNPDPKCGSTLSMDTIGNKTSAVVDPICWR